MQIERQVELRVREERARMAQEAATPRRTGPPAPGTPASLPRKRIKDIVRRMWEDTEMSISQAFKEYEDAVNRVEVAMDRNPQEAPAFIRAADEAKRTWEEAILYRAEDVGRDRDECVPGLQGVQGCRR